MFVPYNLPAYYRVRRARTTPPALEMDKSMMGMMYGWMFKFYMLDRFMSFMAIDGWNTDAYADVRAGRNVEARWLPTDAMLEISHAIRRDGALTCDNCHGPGRRAGLGSPGLHTGRDRRLGGGPLSPLRDDAPPGPRRWRG